MRAYNPMTVIRQTSRSVLKEFFTEHRCLECLNFEKDKLYEIQDAFRTLPEGLLRKVEIVMRNVFNLAGNEAVILRLLDEAKTQNGEFNSEIQQFKNRYDMAFHISDSLGKSLHVSAGGQSSRSPLVPLPESSETDSANRPERM